MAIDKTVLDPNKLIWKDKVQTNKHTPYKQC